MGMCVLGWRKPITAVLKAIASRGPGKGEIRMFPEKAKTLIAKYDIAAFLLFVFGVGWLFYFAGMLFIAGRPDREGWLGLFQTPGALMTLLGAVGVRYARGGKKEVDAVWLKYADWREPWWLYALTILLLPLLAIAAALIQGEVDAVFEEMLNRDGWFAYLELVLLFFVQLPGGPLLEEYGWRGFLQVRLQYYYHPIIAALITGSLWGIHHIPLALSVQGDVLGTVIGATAASLFLAWIFNKSGGSMLLMLLAHASLNIAMLIAPEGYLFYLFIFLSTLFLLLIFRLKDIVTMGHATMSH